MAVSVFIVDDSPMFCAVLRHGLSRSEGVEVVGTASDPYQARDDIVRLRPDVLVLDVHMPRMDGITFLKKIMAHMPMPVVVVSSFKSRDDPIIAEAKRAGAWQVLGKPAGDLRPKDWIASLADMVRQVPRRSLNGVGRPGTPATDGPAAGAGEYDQVLIAIGASTGGTEALERVMRALPADAPPVAIVQHMPAQFTGAFARRLNEACPVEVLEAVDGAPLVAGRAMLAPGSHHLLLEEDARGNLVARLDDGAPVNRHRPSVDVLFASIAARVRRRVVAVMLTGMGRDGALQMKTLHDRGAHGIAQDEQSCVVYGMPKEAVKLGAVDEELPLQQIPAAILAACRKQVRERSTDKV